MELHYFPKICGGPMIYDPRGCEGISLDNFLVMGFEKGYDPSKDFNHIKFNVSEGSFDEYKITVGKIAKMQTDLANALNLPVKAEIRAASKEEIRALIRERELASIS